MASSSTLRTILPCLKLIMYSCFHCLIFCILCSLAYVSLKSLSVAKIHLFNYSCHHIPLNNFQYFELNLFSLLHTLPSIMPKCIYFQLINLSTYITTCTSFSILKLSFILYLLMQTSIFLNFLTIYLFERQCARDR